MKLPFVAGLFLITFLVIIVLIFIWLIYEIKYKIDSEKIRFFGETQDTTESSPHSSQSASELADE